MESLNNRLGWKAAATVYLRLAIGIGYLSAVADRFGVWGPPGTHLVAWGNFHAFTGYTAQLNPWFPASWAFAVAWIATICETVFGIGLIVGLGTRLVAILSGLLALAFAVGMVFGSGIKAPLNYSVFVVSAGSFLLACSDDFPYSLDGLRNRRKHRKCGGRSSDRSELDCIDGPES